MKTRVLIEDQVLRFIRRQPPETRKRLRDTLRAVENGGIFPEPLEDELEGLYKLKIDRIRIILQSDVSHSRPVFKAVFAERRKVVYELFSQILGLD
jgi:mRNA-degrading endonuclease RelE of RelBE toxin-antitoxin system